jgi:hypothetical protein
VSRSFAHDSAINNSGNTESVDVSLVAVSLATLFAIVRRADLVVGLSSEGVFYVLQECLRAIVDPRISSSAFSDCSSSQQGDKERERDKDTAQQIVRALNMVLLKISSEAPTGRSASVTTPFVVDVVDLMPLHCILLCQGLCSRHFFAFFSSAFLPKKYSTR